MRLNTARPNPAPVPGARRCARTAWRAPAGRRVTPAGRRVTPAGRRVALAAAASLTLACLALWPIRGARAAGSAPAPALVPVVDATTVLLSADEHGGKGSGLDATYPPAPARDASHVAFASAATNLVPGDGNGKSDIFVHDLDPGSGTWRTSRVTVGAAGQDADGDSFDPAISADGRYVAFASDAGNLVADDRNRTTDVFLWDREGQGPDRIVRLSTGSLGGDGNSYSWEPSISADGSVVSFLSEASNLVPGDGNGVADVFVRDRTAEPSLTELVSGGPSGASDGGAWQQVLSADGGTVAFASDAANLVPGDGNRSSDVFVHDRSTGRTTLESRASDGSPGDDWSFFPSLSADGGVVAFDSVASNLARDSGKRPDVFVRDRGTGQTTPVSVSPTGATGNSPSYAPSLSADGRSVAFDSSATNLVAGDANGYGSDVFVRDLPDGATVLASLDVGGLAQFDQAYNAAISPDGSHVAFAGLLVAPGAVDVQYYLRGPLRPPPPAPGDAAPPAGPATGPAVDTTATTVTEGPTITEGPTTTEGPTITEAPTTTVAGTTTSTEPATASASATPATTG
jgi:Tol biopolymer transport system component